MTAINGTLSAIRTRATSDTGIGGLFETGAALITGWYSINAPQEGSTLPYVVVFPVDHRRANTFDSAVYTDELQLQVSLFCDANNDLSSDQTISDRIVSRFDRWAPTVSGFTASQLIHDGSSLVQEENGIRHHVFEFRVLLGK